MGLKNKKDIVFDTLREEKIELCLLQEVEIKKDYISNLLSTRDYKIEVKTIYY